MASTVKAADFKGALTRKLHAKLEPRGGDDYYIILAEDGKTELASTSFSRKHNETLAPNRLSQMWKQLHLNDKQDIYDLVDCPLTGEEARARMVRNWPPGSSRLKQ